MLEYHAQFENGFLPYAGGYAEQPAKLMEAINIIARRFRENKLKAADR